MQRLSWFAVHFTLPEQYAGTRATEMQDRHVISFPLPMAYAKLGDPTYSYHNLLIWGRDSLARPHLLKLPQTELKPWAMPQQPAIYQPRLVKLVPQEASGVTLA